MKKYFIILLIVIVVVSFGLIFSFTHTTPQEQDSQQFQYSLRLLPSKESYFLESEGTGAKNKTIIYSKQSITGFSLEGEVLRNATTSLKYDILHNTLDNFLITSISDSDQIDYAYHIFIEDLLAESLWKNLLSGSVSLGERKEIQRIGNIIYERNKEYYDSIGKRQNIIVTVRVACTLGSYFSKQKECSLEGEFLIPTPLASGPIAGKIEGKFTTSLLQ